MMNIKRLTLLLCLLLSMAGKPAFALGAIDGELGVALWNNQFDADLAEGELDVGSLILHGELWLGEKWGVRGAWYDSDLEGKTIDNQQRTQIDVRRRFLSVTDNNFAALGLGVENIDLETGEDTRGLRLSAEGRLSIPPIVYIYGRAGWMPWMEDANNFSDINGRELEVGVSVTPFPFVSLRIAYLKFDLDYDNDFTGASEGSDSSGFIFGVGVHW